LLTVFKSNRLVTFLSLSLCPASAFQENQKIGSRRVSVRVSECCEREGRVDHILLRDDGLAEVGGDRTKAIATMLQLSEE
jgi:hypothetical protein